VIFFSGRFTSCLDLQQKLQAKEDKEYTLQIMGINVRIYCHGMSTDSPQEYLSLPAGEDENFSEIYDRRYVYTLCTDSGRE
jgi:thrombospondin motif-containing protein 9